MFSSDFPASKDNQNNPDVEYCLVVVASFEYLYRAMDHFALKHDWLLQSNDWQPLPCRLQDKAVYPHSVKYGMRMVVQYQQNNFQLNDLLAK